MSKPIRQEVGEMGDKISYNPTVYDDGIDAISLSVSIFAFSA